MTKKINNKYKYQRRRIHPLVLVVLFIAAVTILFVLLWEGSGDPIIEIPTESSEEGTSTEQEPSNPGESTEYTEPSAAPEPTQPPATPIPVDIEGLKQELEEYIALQPGKYGVQFMNLITGEEFGINARDEYIAASTTKLPMNLLLYKKIFSGEVNFDDRLVYTEADYEYGTGIIHESDFGTEYTVRETARLSIVESDNCGINMIIRLLGIENIRQYMLDLGGTIYYGKRHRSCPYDLALYARELYRFYQEAPEIAGILVEDLQNTIFNDRINKYLPENVKVSHKIGNFEGVYNDVGIIFAREPYVLAVMSDGVEHVPAGEVIAQISKKIYDYLEGNQ